MTNQKTLRAVLLRITVLAVMAGLPFSLLAQGIVRPAQTGVIQGLPEEDDFLIISGVRYEFNYDNIEFLLRGEPFDDGALELGMVVRFVLESGQIVRVEVLGPNNLIEDINQT